MRARRVGGERKFVSLSVCVCMCVCVFMHICVCVCVGVCVGVWVGERLKETEGLGKSLFKHRHAVDTCESKRSV
jgi:hypothetical protein